MTKLSGSIIIGYDFEKGQIIQNQPREVNLTSLETCAVETLMSFLSTSIDTSLIHLKKPSESYTSIFYGEYNDFLRFKLTERTKWISIRMSKTDRIENIENPLFSSQSNKKQLHWMAKLSSPEDLLIYKSFILNSCLDN